MRNIMKWAYRIFFALIAVLFMSSISKAFINTAPDKIIILTSSTIEEIAAKLPGTSVVSAGDLPGTLALKKNEKVLSIPYGRVYEYTNLAFDLPEVYRAYAAPLKKPEISFRSYWFFLKDRVTKYARGDLGLIRTTSKYNIPVKSILIETTLRTCAYLIPGLVAGALAAIGLSLLASLRRRAGRLLDGVYIALSGIPDFMMVIFLQLLSIYLTRIVGGRTILVAHFGTEIPFLIPFLSISLIPGVLIYGTLRMAIQRELTRDYVKTAIAKGLSRGEVLTRHIFRNVLEDLLTVMPKATALALGSMAVAEAMCDILGLGGYIVSPRMQNISATPVICIVLAIIALLFHGLFALLGHKFAVRVKEGA